MLKLKELDKLNKPYAIYTDYAEYSALEQFITVMRDDRICAGALMPDVHTGYTLPIGGVVASKTHVFPAFVGYDIGCGVSTFQSSYVLRDTIHHEIRDRIFSVIPVGNKWREAELPGLAHGS